MAKCAKQLQRAPQRAVATPVMTSETLFRCRMFTLGTFARAPAVTRPIVFVTPEKVRGI